MNSLETLRQVAELVGIGTRHTDALGLIHEPDTETLAQIIAALGLPTDPAHAAAALADIDNARPFGLDPLAVVAAEAPVLSLRRSAASAAIEWRCDLEQGGHLEGCLNAGESILPFRGPLPPGYHRLAVSSVGRTTSTSLAAAPSACYLPQELQASAHRWGLTTQLYGLRSARNWGMGDFNDLAQLCRGAASEGAATVGINPLHALFASEPRHISPYSPSNRSMLDYLYIDPTTVPGFENKLVPEAELERLRATEFVDRQAVAAAKRPVLERAYARFRRRDLRAGAETRDGAAFRAFQAVNGRPLAAFATFESLHEQFNGREGIFSWHSWPVGLRDPNSPEVAAFARAHRARIEFFEFLQWLADRQLGAAAAVGHADGLTLGLYRDLAVGVNPHGAEAWADQGLVVRDMGIGAPPDPLSRLGQDWGLAPVNPLALRQAGFHPFIAALRANMRHAGVLRIDHVMSLQRLYWVPRGRTAVDGAYVTYPFEQLLRLVALESHRQRCAVVGEDLGTVPPAFRETMQRANLLSYRIVAFERRADGKFLRPWEYPALAAASAATHDLPTLKGFWLGRDIAWRHRLGSYPDAAVEAAELKERYSSRWQLLEALEAEGLMPRDRFGQFISDNADPVFTEELGLAILAFLARSRARLMLVQLEDVAAEEEQANLPGTDDEHPNWRRKLAMRLEELLASSEFHRIATRVNEERRHAP